LSDNDTNVTSVDLLEGSSVSEGMEKAILDVFFDLYDNLVGTKPYNYNSWGKPYEWIRANGGHCSSTPHAIWGKMGLRQLGDTRGIMQNMVAKQPYRREADCNYFRGAIIVTDRWIDKNGDGVLSGGAEDFTHVGFIYDGFKFIHTRGPQGTHGHQIDANSEVSNREWFAGWPGWGGYEMVGIHPQMGVDFDPEKEFGEQFPAISKDHPIWCAHPYLLALAYGYVAKYVYDLPERIAVMCSMQEVQDMWVPGRLRFDECHGYFKSADHDSFGAFQQRPSMGWGTPEQIKDLRYSVHKFCQVAVETGAKEVANSDKWGLTQAIQDVQRSAFPDAYARWFDASQAFIDRGWSLIPKRNRPDDDKWSLIPELNHPDDKQ
jgi:hypothetical protein